MSNQTKDGGPAFPVPLNQGEAYKEHGPADGMMLRDYFAAKAMQGMAAAYHENWTVESIAANAYDIADAMLAARNQTNTKD